MTKGTGAVALDRVPGGDVGRRDPASERGFQLRESFPLPLKLTAVSRQL